MYPIVSVFSVTSVQEPHSNNAPPIHSRNEEWLIKRSESTGKCESKIEPAGQHRYVWNGRKDLWFEF
jgi:hypothetical protein